VKKESTKDFIKYQFELQLRMSLQVLARAWTKDILRSTRCNKKHTGEIDSRKEKIEYTRQIWITLINIASLLKSTKLALISTE